MSRAPRITGLFRSNLTRRFLGIRSEALNDAKKVYTRLPRSILGTPTSSCARVSFATSQLRSVEAASRDAVLANLRQQFHGLALTVSFFRKSCFVVPASGQSCSSKRQWHRSSTCAMWAVTFAMAIKNVRGALAFALQSFNQTALLFSLAAIAAAQKLSEGAPLDCSSHHSAWQLRKGQVPSGLTGTEPTAAKSHN